MKVTRTVCCVVSGGPAGVVLGFLLARAGVEVTVLEKHADFLRDFRGDTIHPSTLELMHELGFLEEFLARPNYQASQMSGIIEGQKVTVADFSHLPTRCKFIAFMPQWDFLDFLVGKAKRYPSFHLRRGARATGLVEESGKVVGVKIETSEGPEEIHATLVVGADGRGSMVREACGIEVENLGAPMDVLWMRLSRKAHDLRNPLGRFTRGNILIMIDRGDYWQCGFLIPKGHADEIRGRGLETFRKKLVETAPELRDRVGELKSWDDVKMLTVSVNRIKQWYREGLLLIGDAAHAMSPVGGVGINLAIQDAVAAANILSGPLARGELRLADLERVQKRRLPPTKLTQWFQVQIQKRVIGKRLNGETKAGAGLPVPLRLLQKFPMLQRIPARWIGIGFRPEHIQTDSAVIARTASETPRYAR